MIPARQIGIAFLFVAIACTRCVNSAQGAPVRKRAFDEPAQPVDWNAKRVVFDVHRKPWHDVLRWFAQEAQIPIITKGGPPNGTVTFISRTTDGKPRDYSLNEVFDILNEMLMAEHKLILVRRENSLVLLPADAEVPAGFFRPATLGELPHLARTEIVEVTVYVRGTINGGDVAKQPLILRGLASDVRQMVARLPR